MTSLTWADIAQLPILNWQPQPDWINIKAEPYNAKGDGKTDDAAAINAALNAVQLGGVVYFPAGTYRITQRLVMGSEGNKYGVQLLGTGRTTTVLWDGTTDSVMLHTRGAHSAEFNGITWDGNSKARIGVFHFACGYMYEGQQRHDNEAFINFPAGSGIRGSSRSDQAANGNCNSGFNPAAEMDIRNCLFVNCGYGIRTLIFNYFNWVVEGCEFRNCGIGANTMAYGGLYLRFCHFENSKLSDFVLEWGSSSSVRYCTSKGSKRFGWAQDITIQDCSIDAAVMDKDSALILNSPRGPFLVSDLFFTNWKSPKKPIVMTAMSPHDSDYAPVHLPQQIIFSNIVIDGAIMQSPVSGKTLSTDIHATTQRSNPLFPPETSFLNATIKAPGGQVFNVAKEGAKGDNNTDDAAAIQRAVDKAAKAGNDAWVYFPKGTYKVGKKISIAGSDFTISGTGGYTILNWAGKKSGSALFEVSGARNVTIKNFQMPFESRGKEIPGILVKGAKTSTNLTLDRIWAYGAYYGPSRDAYEMSRSGNGLVFDNLGKSDTVHVIRIVGALWNRNSTEAIIVVNFSEAWPLILSSTKPKTGFFGYLTRSHADARIYNSCNLVVGDQYIEQVGNCNGVTAASTNCWILSGEDGDAPGRVTVAGVKLDFACSDTIARIRNYNGNFFWSSWNIEGGPCQAGYPGSYKLIYSQTGKNPVSILLSAIQTGDMNHPETCRWPFVFSTTSHAKVAFIQNKWLDQDIYPDNDVAGTKKAYATALDDFRMLGRWAYKLEYNRGYTWAETAMGDTLPLATSSDALRGQTGTIKQELVLIGNEIVSVYPGKCTLELSDSTGVVVQKSVSEIAGKTVLQKPAKPGKYQVKISTDNGTYSKEMFIF